MHAEFTSRFDECHRGLARFAASRFHSSVRDEVVSECWHQAWLSYGSFRGGSFRSWLFSIALHVGLNILRREKRYRDNMRRYASRLAPAGSHEDRVAARVDVARLLRGVGETDALVVRMLSQGYTSGELARMCGTTRGAISQRRHRALVSMRAKDRIIST